MTATDDAESRAGWIRETYEEYADGDDRIATIADPENGHAWIQSDCVVEVVP